ncbi:MAG: flagellar hook-basal body protein [Eubacteriaceae bacterium]
MIRSLYTTRRYMNVLQKKQENTSSNIANVNTYGYKFQNVIHSTLESQDLINYSGGNNINEKQHLGEYTFGNQIDEVYSNYVQGNLIETHQDKDFAINGEGFFAVQLEDGKIGFTRNGNFKLNENNQLTTMEGYNVLGVDNNDEISYITLDESEVDIKNTGDITGTNLKLIVVGFEDENSLKKYGDTIYTTDENQINIIQGNIQQGFLEASNVSLVSEMVKMIEISREFESNQKVLQSSNETLSKAVNEVGKV